MRNPMTLNSHIEPGVARERFTLTSTVRLLWPYIWPADRTDLKVRIGLAFALMLLSKLITVVIPYSFKWVTDSLAGKLAGGRRSLEQITIGAGSLTVLYGALRIFMALTQQGRDALFAAVAMNAVRKLAIEVFEHLHLLSLRFHLERKTGGLTRVLERGRNAIETIIRTSMLTAAPTVVEFALVVGALLISFDWRYVAAIGVTVAAYLTYTTLATNWRIGFRRSMNDSDADANTKAIDSLLNFETVKYFGAEAREAARYDRAMARYERMSVRTYVSLAVLNAGQAFIFTVGLIGVLLLCVAEIKGGRRTVGDFVLLNLMMLQLYQPLNFMGMVYRDIKQAIVDIEAMFAILDQNPEIKDLPAAPPLSVTRGRRAFRERRFRLRSGAADPARRLVRGEAGPDDRDRRAVGRRQIDDLAAALPLLRADVGTDPDRRPGHRARSRRVRCAPRSAWFRRTRCCSTIRSSTTSATAATARPGRGRGGGRGRPDRRLHPLAAARLRSPGRRARAEAVGRREAARRHRPHHPEGAADPGPGRGDLRARHVSPSARSSRRSSASRGAARPS